MLNPSDTLRSRAAAVSTNEISTTVVCAAEAYYASRLHETNDVSQNRQNGGTRTYPNHSVPTVPVFNWTTSLDLGRHFKRAQLIVIYLYLSIICYNFNLHWLIDCQLIASFLSNFELLAELRRIPNSVACKPARPQWRRCPGPNPGPPLSLVPLKEVKSLEGKHGPSSDSSSCTCAVHATIIHCPYWKHLSEFLWT